MAKQIVGICLTVIISYLIGSVNFAIIISGLVKKDDVRTYGSGNAGMTNMLRTYGKGLGAVTALGDGLKGAVAVLVARLVLVPLFGITIIDVGYLSGVFVLLGHIFPIFFGFRGGKGVMTGLGIILALNPLVFLILVVIVLPVVFITRIVSLGSIIGAVLFPIVTVVVRIFEKRSFGYDGICATFISLIILIMHRDNIKRLMNGTENRFVKK